jgi:alkylation response protein AidB-like acyl-CoA dehydrogenase
MILMEEFGKVLLIEPFLSTVVVAGGALRRSAPNSPLIRAIIAGQARIALAAYEAKARYNWADVTTEATRDGESYRISGAKAVVLGAPFCTHLLVTARSGGARRDPGGLSLFVVDIDTPGLQAQIYRIYDGGRAADIMFEDMRVPSSALIGAEGAAAPLIELLLDEAAAASCAESCGVLRCLLQSTVDYCKQRTQFGQKIGQFQALQHRMADMFIETEQAVSMSLMAHLKLADDQARAGAVSAAKVKIGKALRFVGENAVQLHGGMGVSDELAVGHYFKRATLLENAFGSADYHLARYERLADQNPG